MTTVKMTKTEERNVEINAAFNAGESKNSLASRFNLTVRTIQHIVAASVVVVTVATATPAVAGTITGSIPGSVAGTITVTGDSTLPGNPGKTYDLDKIDQVDTKADDADFQAVKTQVSQHTNAINTNIANIIQAQTTATTASTGVANEVHRATSEEQRIEGVVNGKADDLLPVD